MSLIYCYSGTPCIQGGVISIYIFFVENDTLYETSEEGRCEWIYQRI